MARLHRTLRTALCLALLAVAAQGATPVPPTEYEVKAAFLYNFAKYVEWPESASDDTFIVGILGEDPFGRVIDDTLAGKEIKGHKLAVRRFTTAEEARQARILFIGTASRRDLTRILGELAGRPVLTVGEAERFASLGGMVGFRVQGESVRFDINADEVARGHLRMSSQLLKLARIVHTGERD
jgi:hypothetical protein